ncbi:MAG: hypothetical protein WCS99_09500 [Limisphaerales bacterium]
MTRPSTKKVIKIAAIVVCVLILLLVVFPGYVAAVVGPPLDRIQARRAFSRAKTPEELRGAVGHWGAFFPLRDGSWVAVRYTDTHAAPGYYCAIAHDSGGQWFYSSHHFCGRFRIYFQFEKRTRELAAATGDTEAEVQSSLSRHDAQMFGLATATNLAAARAQLLTMGFSQ